MGFFSLTITGTAFIVIGAWESLTSTAPNPYPFPPSPLTRRPQPKSNPNLRSSLSSSLPLSSSFTYITATIFSVIAIFDCLISFFNAISSKDGIGSALQLQNIAVALLFVLYSCLGLLSIFSRFVHFPSEILNLVVLFAFVEEFLLFYLQRKDTSGIENRYFDLMLVPISICVFSTILELLKTESRSRLYAKLGRGMGLVLQGTWFLQMGVSFYSGLIVQGCSLHEKSRGNYTIRCKGHPEYHRGRGIATLQFNCHLALLVVVMAIVYSILSNNNMDHGEFMRYKPLGEEVLQMVSHGQFTLDSDEDDEMVEEADNVAKEKGAIVEMSSLSANGSQE